MRLIRVDKQSAAMAGLWAERVITYPAVNVFAVLVQSIPIDRLPPCYLQCSVNYVTLLLSFVIMRMLIDGFSTTTLCLIAKYNGPSESSSRTVD